MEATIESIGKDMELERGNQTGKACDIEWVEHERAAIRARESRPRMEVGS